MSIAVAPSGHLYFGSGSSNIEDPAAVLLERAARDPAGDGEDAVTAYFLELARFFLAALCAVPELEKKRAQVCVEVPAELLAKRAAAAPPILGAEYLTGAALADLWRSFEGAYRTAIAAYPGTVQAWLAERSPVWSVLGRVCFHLAENKKSEDLPFAFIATFVNGLSEGGKARHLPLARALDAYRGAKEKMLALLVPVQKAAEQSELTRELLEHHAIFHPLAWSPEQAHRFLLEVPTLEAAGIVVRVPDWWRKNRRPRPEVRIKIGDSAAAGAGMDALLDFKVELTVDGEPLEPEEKQKLFAEQSGLRLIKGRWVELDRDQLRAVLGHWETAQKAHRNGLSFAEAMRLLSGFSAEPAPGAETNEVIVERGVWLAQAIENLRAQQTELDPILSRDLRARLRPYQKAGVEWLCALDKLRLGACLADDMGLGKTIQIIAFLLANKTSQSQPSLLVVPATLIPNWTAELSRFAPSLTSFVAHPSAVPAAELKSLEPARFDGIDLVITTYGSVHRYPVLSERAWNVLILDEAQAIKNPGTRQTRTIKSLQARMRIALTGTPIENRLSDLWSLFDFLSPGLLGSAKLFGETMKHLQKQGAGAYLPLRALIRPYVLRRLKTDRTIIDDLPEKTEQRVWCGLTRVQAALYEQTVRELRETIAKTDGIKRRGLILAFLMRFKQLCNHPAQGRGDGAYDPKASAKMLRLRELAEEIALRQDKMLVFTQFREMTAPLASLLEQVYGRPGLILTGSTSIGERKKRVDVFQAELGPPFFVLSLKAGGTGLNLTAASHVVHFDRWWNPAVEDQATDRAFRLGQKKNVLVHKFVCRGTIEERIDAMISEKRALSGELLGEGGAEVLLTELPNEELLRLVALDLSTALAQG